MSTRSSDRWLTPAVLVALILAGTVVVLGVLAAVTYLTLAGLDPAPVVQLTGTLVGAVSALGTFVVQLVTRRTTANVQRQTGRLATGLGGVLDELDAARGRHAPGQSEGRPSSRPAAQRPSPPAGVMDRGPADEETRYADTPEEDLHDTAWFRQ